MANLLFLEPQDVYAGLREIVEDIAKDVQQGAGHPARERALPDYVRRALDAIALSENGYTWAGEAEYFATTAMIETACDYLTLLKLRFERGEAMPPAAARSRLQDLVSYAAGHQDGDIHRLGRQLKSFYAEIPWNDLEATAEEPVFAGR